MFRKPAQFGDIKLRDVPALPLVDRARYVDNALEGDLPAALSDADLGAIRMLRWRAAWAVGFNLTLGFTSAGRQSNCEVPSQLQRHFAKFGKCTVREIIQRLCLDDLVRSVACEQIDDWQPDDTRPVDRSAAEKAFFSVYRRYQDQVTARMRRQTMGRPGNADAAVDDAWGRAFQCYWSIAATTRYRAAASLPATISIIALRLAWKATKEVQWPINRDGSDVEFATTQDPGTLLDADEEKRNLARRMETLPPRQRLIAELVMKHNLSQAEVARRLGTTEANISILLKKARKTLQSQKFQVFRLSS